MKMAVLLSGTGRTLDNFHENIKNGSMQGSIEVVVSNVAGVLGLEKAEKYGYPAFHAPDNQAINRILADYDIELVLLAGYLKLYKPPARLERRVVNIHPALTWTRYIFKLRQFTSTSWIIPKKRSGFFNASWKSTRKAGTWMMPNTESYCVLKKQVPIKTPFMPAKIF